MANEEKTRLDFHDIIFQLVINSVLNPNDDSSSYLLHFFQEKCKGTTSESIEQPLNNKSTYCDSSTILKSFRKDVQKEYKELKIHPCQYKYLYQYGLDLFIFKFIPRDILCVKIIKKLIRYAVPKGTVMTEQGEYDDFFYIIEKGTYQAHMLDKNHKRKTVTLYSESGSFGEISFIYNRPSKWSVVALSDGIVWALGRQDYINCTSQVKHQKQKIMKDLIKKVPQFQILRDKDLEDLVNNLQFNFYIPGEEIIGKDQVRIGMYFVLDGCVHTVNKYNSSEEQEHYISKGGYFGELTGINLGKTIYSFVAIELTHIALINADSLDRIYKLRYFPVMFYLNEYNEQLSKITGNKFSEAMINIE